MHLQCQGDDVERERTRTKVEFVRLWLCVEVSAASLITLIR